MTPNLESVEYVGGYKVRLAFSDGAVGVVDLESELWGEVFEPLRDPEQFRRFRLDTELNTVTWPSGADLAPEFLYERTPARPAAEGPQGGPRPHAGGRPGAGSDCAAVRSSLAGS
jgi:hypothetical protein